jgi:hypothetical protein
MSVIYRYKYIPSRRVTYADLGDVRWRYVEAPPSMAANMAGCPTSSHEWGIIETDRFVLPSAQTAAGLAPVESYVAGTAGGS